MSKEIITKVCSKCREVKPRSEFPKRNSRPCGIMSRCKECANKISSEYRKTKNGITKDIFADQRNHSKNRGHDAPPYALFDLRNWCYSQQIFHELYDKWVASGYDRWAKPSCDRLDNSKGYSFDNLRIVTWQKNSVQADIDAKIGKLTRSHKPVIQFSITGEFINQYMSATQAARETGYNFRNISACCIGNQKTSNGFCWKFKEDK